MKSDQSKTKAELIQELQSVQKRISTQDITERKGAEEALRESEEKFRTLFEDSRDAIFISSLDGSTIDFNRSAEEMLGYSREELLSLSMEDLYARKEDRLQFRKIIEAKGYVKDYELQLLKKDGSVINCLDSATVRRDIDGNIIGYQGIIRDITERKQMESKLQETNTFLRNILECSTSVSIISTDWEGNILYWNQGAEIIFGYKSEEIVGHQKISILYPDDEEETSKIVKAVRSFIQKNKKGTSCEVVEVTKDGRKLWVYMTLSPRLNESGEVIGILGIGEDITERKRVEENLKASHRILETVFNNAPFMIWGADEKGILHYFNKKSVEIMGYTNEEAIGMSNMKLHPPDKRDEVHRKFKLHVEEKLEDRLELPLYTKSRKRLIGSMSQAIYEDEFNKKWYFGFIEDITERKRAESELRLFSESVEEAADGIQITDLIGYITYSNKAVEEIYGFSPDEFKGKHVNELNVDPEFAVNVIIPSIKETGHWAGELMVKHKDGGEFPIWLTISMVKDIKGEPIAMVGIIRDITERKRIEEEREKLIIQLQEAFDKIDTMSGLIPICAWCKKVRDDQGYWNEVEAYIEAHSKAEFSHGICPNCAKKHLNPKYKKKTMKKPKK